MNVTPRGFDKSESNKDIGSDIILEVTSENKFDDSLLVKSSAGEAKSSKEAELKTSILENDKLFDYLNNIYVNQDSSEKGS